MLNEVQNPKSKVKILGTNIDRLSFLETVHKIKQIIEKKQKGFIVTANPEILYRAYINRSYANVLDQAELITADGVGALLAARFRGKKIPERITGIDLTWALAKLAEEKNYKIYLLGGEPANNYNNEIAKTAAHRLKLIHPRIKIVGASFGFWDKKGSEEKVIADIQKTKPNLLFVAFGPPKQEKWIAENLNKFDTPIVAIGIGGALDMIAGKFKRAPFWMQKCGLEWLYRLIQEPKRILRIWNVIKFMFLALFTNS